MNNPLAGVRGDLAQARVWSRVPGLTLLFSDAIMGEVLNVIVAFAVIVFAVRWATKGPLHVLSPRLLLPTLSLGKEQSNSPGAVLGFRPKHVTDEMVHIFQRTHFNRTEERASSGQFYPHDVSRYPKVQLTPHIMRPMTDPTYFQTEHSLLAFTNRFCASNI